MRGVNLSYFVRRIGMFFLVIFVAASFNFVIPRLAPGNPIGAITSRMSQASAGIENGQAMFEAYRKRFGLDDPLYIQYAKYMWNTLRLDFGESLSAYPAEVWDIVGPAIGWSISLIGVSVLITFVLGILIGALLAWKGTPELVRALLPITMFGGVLPYYLLAMLLLYVFAFTTRLLPMSGAFDSGMVKGFNWPFIKSLVSHAILPALSIILTSIGGWALSMRSLMINTIGEDYMLLAEAKGLPKRRILWWYAVRNVIPPQLAHLAIALGYVVSGAILVEIVFSYPGLGYQLYMSIVNSDYTVIQGITLILAISVGLAVLIIDLIYPRLDPRVTYVSESAG
ncbi:MAG: ABC transporter permease, partial [Caldilineaceae bacterium]|nr:ABC transporter permease [Caldilineaceae bacterium]MCB9149677.1 ABC transporter permease [Caldilineaceae bacterium]